MSEANLQDMESARPQELANTWAAASALTQEAPAEDGHILCDADLKLVLRQMSQQLRQLRQHEGSPQSSQAGAKCSGPQDSTCLQPRVMGSAWEASKTSEFIETLDGSFTSALVAPQSAVDVSSDSDDAWLSI